MHDATGGYATDTWHILTMPAGVPSDSRQNDERSQRG